MNPEANPMPLVSDCDPVDACDEYKAIPMFCPMCGGRLEQLERKE